MQVLDEVPMIWGSCFMVYTMQGVLTIASYSFTSTLCLGHFSHRLLFPSLVWFDGRIILGVWSYALLIPLEFPSVLFLYGLHPPIVLILISMSSLEQIIVIWFLSSSIISYWTNQFFQPLIFTFTWLLAFFLQILPTFFYSMNWPFTFSSASSFLSFCLSFFFPSFQFIFLYFSLILNLFLTDIKSLSSGEKDWVF